MLIIAAVLIGGRSIIGPMLERAMAQPGDTYRKGSIVFTMPDGTFCRHLAYDNKTAELTESTVRQCPEARPREAAHPPTGFAWAALASFRRHSVLPPSVAGDAFFRLIETFRKMVFSFRIML